MRPNEEEQQKKNTHQPQFTHKKMQGTAKAKKRETTETLIKWNLIFQWAYGRYYIHPNSLKYTPLMAACIIFMVSCMLTQWIADSGKNFMWLIWRLDGVFGVLLFFFCFFFWLIRFLVFTGSSTLCLSLSRFDIYAVLFDSFRSFDLEFVFFIRFNFSSMVITITNIFCIFIKFKHFFSRSRCRSLVSQSCRWRIAH